MQPLRARRSAGRMHHLELSTDPPYPRRLAVNTGCSRSNAAHYRARAPNVKWQFPNFMEITGNTLGNQFAAASQNTAGNQWPNVVFKRARKAAITISARMACMPCPLSLHLSKSGNAAQANTKTRPAVTDGGENRRRVCLFER